MPEAAVRRRRGPAASILALAGLAALAVFAPLIANDRPILAAVGGRWVAPAMSGVPLLGRWFDSSPVPEIDWNDPPGDVRIVLRPPVPYSYRGISLGEVLQPPGRHHLLGTDALGRDLLARLIHGTRTSFRIGLVATCMALLLGSLIGGCAGLRGGLADVILMRVADTVACFPPLILALAFVVAWGGGPQSGMVAAIALSRWTGTARYVRAEILRLAGSDLWNAARAAGGSLPRIALRHLTPLLMPPLAVMAAFGVAHAMVLESSLSFVGLGVAPPTPSWGLILAEARPAIDTGWWLVLFPSLCLLLVLASLCIAGERTSGQDDSAPF